MSTAGSFGAPIESVTAFLGSVSSSIAAFIGTIFTYFGYALLEYFWFVLATLCGIGCAVLLVDRAKKEFLVLGQCGSPGRVSQSQDVEACSAGEQESDQEKVGPPREPVDVLSNLAIGVCVLLPPLLQIVLTVLLCTERWGVARFSGKGFSSKAFNAAVMTAAFLTPVVVVAGLAKLALRIVSRCRSQAVMARDEENGICACGEEAEQHGTAVSLGAEGGAMNDELKGMRLCCEHNATRNTA